MSHNEVCFVDKRTSYLITEFSLFPVVAEMYCVERWQGKSNFKIEIENVVIMKPGIDLKNLQMPSLPPTSI